jgi:Terminase RNaseH-like domain
VTAGSHEIVLPYPHPGQQTVRVQAKRFNWLSAGRRWRKTTLAMVIAVEAAAGGKRVIWGAPVFDQVRLAWDETRRAALGVADFNMSRMTVTFPSGGELLFRSLDSPDNVRGHTADGVVMDECGDLRPEAWYEVLRPMLIDTQGWAWGVGTPKGRNWFYIEHQNARDRPDSWSWQAPTLGVRRTEAGLERAPHPLENPHIALEEITELWRMMPERTFEQEVLAQFIEADGAVFRKVREAATATPQAAALDGHRYCVGVDWAKISDFNVCAVVDLTTKELVALERSNQVDYQVQLSRLQALCERFRPDAIYAEQNAMGEPLVEQLQRMSLPVYPFKTTNATKAAIIDGLALALEREEVRLLQNEVLLNELLSYQAERLPSGLTRYSAPSGGHDDCVIGLALAYYGASQPTQWVF